MQHPTPSIVNVGRRLTRTAEQMPDAVAVVEPLGYRAGRRQYRQVTFRELEDDSNRIAAGLRAMGIRPGMRIALLVRPGIDFISLSFALFKAGVVTILIDPGMGPRNMVRCLEEAKPEGFVAIPLAHVVRSLLRRRFPHARHLVTVGRRWFWGGTTLEALRRAAPTGDAMADTTADDPAAIIFTSGGTGPPKGVLYCHGNFDAQVDQIRQRYGIQAGEIDLPAFPLFGLFNCAMGVTAVIPDMDPSRPARVDPKKIVEAVLDCSVTQAFGSPAIWRRVGQYCTEHGIRLPTVRRVLSAGAPVPAEVLAEMKQCIASDGEVFTPYGATEALPVASIGADEVLSETAAATRQGRGVCVGGKFSGIQWKIIATVSGPVPTMADATLLPVGQIGELIVSGPVVTRRYITRTEANALAKIADGEHFWHRMGDLGYLDDRDRFWMCGRLAHRVLTADGPMYSVCCEAIFNQHPQVARSALVGVGAAGAQRPVIVVELRPAVRLSAAGQKQLFAELRALGAKYEHTAGIEHFLVHPAFPVDVRHNVKIAREKLAQWATGKFGDSLR
jgi:acyl-CoA synthetase (AMP-forming)/AMP-acid ligase II